MQLNHELRYTEIMDKQDRYTVKLLFLLLFLNAACGGKVEVDDEKPCTCIVPSPAAGSTEVECNETFVRSDAGLCQTKK